MKITEENIWKKAWKSNLEVLNSDLVDKVKNRNGWTPLHVLAMSRIKEVLNHPSVDQVKDRYGDTPLHFLAFKGVKDVLPHPSVDKIKDRYGWTPLHHLARFSYLIEEDLRNKYPWYKKEIKNIYKAVEEIVNTPRSIQFILED